MATPASRAVPIVSDAGSTDEEGRRFYQDRLRLFTGCVFLISGGFYLVGTVMRLVADRAIVPGPVFFSPPLVLHLVATLVAGGLSLFCRRAPMSFAALRRLDVAATVFLAVCYALMSAAFAVEEKNDLLGRTDERLAVVQGLFASSYVVLARAVALPSAASRTAWISAIAMTPIVVVNLLVLAQRGVGGVRLANASIDVTTWAVAAVTLAAISSRIIFGLRAEAARIRRLGQYALEEKVGEGGMGVVYRGYHAMLRRPTAIKLLPPERLGVVKVVDFGLVRRVDPAGMDATLSISGDNVIQGTPLYLSPEAIRNEPGLDARSDLYALGAVGYFLLTGKPVFEATTVMEIFAHHLHTSPIPPSRRASQPIPAALDAAILRCLAKDPAERPKDAQTLRHTLASCPCEPWSTDRAAAWWAVYRARKQSQRAAVQGSEFPTLTVDLEHREAV